jgi:hypothetical protein
MLIELIPIHSGLFFKKIEWIDGYKVVITYLVSILVGWGH